jgi:hypothetical protein
MPADLIRSTTSWMWSGAATALLVPVMILTSGTPSARAVPAAASPVVAEAAPELQPFPAKFSIERSDDPQVLEIHGERLAPARSVRVTSPRGWFVSTYTGRSLADGTPTSVRLTAQFAEPGTYSIVFGRADGERSNEITVVVRQADLNESRRAGAPKRRPR